jgi:uncharacterized protein (TIGR00730 family)
MAIRSICVYAGSSPGAKTTYRHHAVELGRELARRQIGLVYGGASVGLMGIVADSVLAEGGTVTGVITEALVDHEISHKGLTNLEIVDSMHDRKTRMSDLSDAFIMLPGGFGTMEEFFEVVTWTQLGIHQKPCGILDVDGFFNPLIEIIERAVEDRFMRIEHAQIVKRSSDPAQLIAQLEDYRPVVVDKWIDRSDR